MIGPHTWTVRDLVSEMIEQGAARRVEDARGLGEAVADLFADEAGRAEGGLAARRLCERHRGAVGRTLDAILEMLEPR